jgi:hypothetical protein
VVKGPGHFRNSGARLVNSSTSLHAFYLIAVGAAVACGGRQAVPPERPAIEAAPAMAAGTPLRRLTQEQYRNTVRDLLGIADIGTDLGIDEGIAGFFGNTIAPVSELHLEKYGRAAELIARQASARLPALLPCDPRTVPEAACAHRFIVQFGRRAYRRPLTAEETATFEALHAEGRRQQDFATGTRLVMEAMLQSPHFLYLFEAPAGPRGGVRPVAPLALASRLSYFLWNSMPDEALLAAAENNRLGTRAEVSAQVTRMLADRRFDDTVASFHLQWLDLTELGSVEKRNRIYPKFTHDLRAAMREETVRFVEDVVRRGDGRLQTLLAARYSIVNGPLRDLYGIDEAGHFVAPPPPSKQAPAEAQKDDQKDSKKDDDAAKDEAKEKPKPVTKDKDVWRRVELGQARRAGLLTQASVMSMHAHWDKPSLVLRGKVIREKLFCTVLPPPPPDVNNTLPQADSKVSARERFEDHRADMGCAKCHRLIDPLGIPFEGYDGIGAVRTMDGPVAVDAESDVTDTAGSNGPVKDAVELMDRLSRSDEVGDCAALQWFRFAIGRDEVPEDAASLGQIRRAFRESGRRVPALVAAIAASDSFRYQRAP